jgi:predicted nuclease of predicted toxin-antitoxin system
VRILLDECVNPRVRQAFPDHEILTVIEAKWRTLPDTELIARAQGQFDVFVTIDRGFEFEHNLAKLTFGIVIVHVPKNRLESYQPIFPALLASVERVKSGEVIHVAAPLA